MPGTRIGSKTDSAAAKNSEKGGGGVVIRDQDGRFLAGAFHFFPCLSGPEESELKASLRGMSLVQELGLTKVVMETDSLSVVSKWTRELKDRSVHGPVVERIKVLL